MAELLIIFGLIILNGIFAMSEIALVSSRKTRLESQANKGDARAKEALKLANHPEIFISTVQFGVTLISILLGVFSGENIKNALVLFLNQFNFLQRYSSPIATTLVVIFITYLILVIGELVPKRIGLSNPEGIAKFMAGPMRIITNITYPFIWLLSKSSNFLIRIFNIRKNETQVTEDEIKAIISEGTEHGAIEETEQQIIERVFHLGDRNITSLMTHRSDVVWLDSNITVEEVKQKYEVHSVYPVCEGSVDTIKGVVSLKDLFLATPQTLLKDVMQQAAYVPENNTAYQLLEKFKETKTHYAFIVDEYGTLQGIITLNDILEAIVGDIAQPDEDNYEIIKRDDGTYLVDAQIPFYNFLTHFQKTEWLDEEEEEDQDFDTLAGFILHHLKRIPATGEKFHWRDFNFEIVDMDGHRIDKLLVTISEEMKAAQSEL
ncbi:MAG: hemolysin family protein [Chitinophagaceae bacterium]